MILVLAFISGAPLFTIMLGGAALGAMSLPREFSSEFDGMVEHVLNVGLGDQVQVMSTIPLFIYAGYLLAEARTADRLVRFANAMLGWVPGGLAIVTIGTCALFTVFTGASGVTIIALGGVLMPALVKNGYPERFSIGLIAGTGSVGLLFPPALPLFIYGTVYGLTNLEPEAWDTRRFLFAGIVPGMVLVGMLSAVAVTVAIMKKLPRQRFDAKELIVSFLAALPELFVPFGVIGGLAIGFALPEIAALTVLYVVVLEVVVLRMLKLRVLWTTSREAMAMVGAIFIIIFASTAMTNFMVTADVPKKLVVWTQAHVESKIVFLLAINGILLLVGTVMDIFSAIVVVLPLIAPIAKAYGIDPYHLGVIFLLNLEVGYLHPPVGLNLFISSVKFQRPITEVMWATIPFLITMIVALLTITYIPALTVVPEPERRGTIGNLAQMVHDGVSEGRSVKDVALVDAAGAPLMDAAGKPIVRYLKDCAALKSDNERDACQTLFFDVSNCKTAPTPDVCAHQKIAAWVVANQESGKEILVVREIPLVNTEGAPVKDKAGAAIIRKLDECAKLDGSDLDECRELFVTVSNCRISPPAAGADGCVKDAVATWADEHVGHD
jgi:tripartite ATP-independent transporter DctM subunit